MSMQQSEGATAARRMSAVRTADGFSTKPDHIRRRAAREARRQRERAEILEAAALGVSVVPKLRLDRSWTEAEDAALVRLKDDDAAALKALPGRSLIALKRRRAKLFIADRCVPWTTLEDKVLRAKVPKVLHARELAPFLPGRTVKAISRHITAIGLKLEPAAADTGNPVVDAIKDRCRRLGYTMIDLDQMCSTGTYFTRKRWRHGADSDRRLKSDAATAYVRAIGKALSELGGELRVEWSD